MPYYVSELLTMVEAKPLQSVFFVCIAILYLRLMMSGPRLY